jgi:hypothetical protein
MKINIDFYKQVISELIDKDNKKIQSLERKYRAYRKAVNFVVKDISVFNSEKETIRYINAEYKRILRGGK